MLNIEKFSAEIAENIWSIVMDDCCPTGLGEEDIFFWRLRQFDNLMSYNGGAAWDCAFAKMSKNDQTEYLEALYSDSHELIDETEGRIQEILKAKYDYLELPYDN